MAKEKKKKGSIVINIFIILLFIVGAGIFTYPTISNYWNEYRNAQLVTKYNESVSDLSDDQYEKLWQEAEEYNAEHKVNTIVDAFNEEDYVLSHPYDEVLDPNGAYQSNTAFSFCSESVHLFISCGFIALISTNYTGTRKGMTT